MYGRNVKGIAHKLAMDMIKDMQLVPVYDIPEIKKADACGMVSESHGYGADGEDNKDINNADIKQGKDTASGSVTDKDNGQAENDGREEQEGVPEKEKEQGRSR